MISEGVFFRFGIAAMPFIEGQLAPPPIVPGQLGGIVVAVAPQPDTSGSRTVGSPTTRLPPLLLGKFPPGSIQVPGPPTCRAIQNMSPPGRGRCCCGASASPDLFMAPRGRWRGRGKDREKDHRDESRESRSRDMMMVEPSSTIITVLTVSRISKAVSYEPLHLPPEPVQRRTRQCTSSRIGKAPRTGVPLCQQQPCPLLGRPLMRLLGRAVRRDPPPAGFAR